MQSENVIPFELSLDSVHSLSMENSSALNKMSPPTYNHNDFKVSSSFNYLNISEVIPENMNTLAIDLINNPITMPLYCSDHSVLMKNVKLYLLNGCSGEWIHKGGGCFECHGSSWGIYRCCDGDEKNCKDPILE